MAKGKFVIGAFAPIPESERTEWEAIVTKGKRFVAGRDKNNFELIYLLGQIESKYGESRVRRFAEDVGIAYSTARQYRKLSELGVDREFVEKYVSLGYTKIRMILFHAGKATNPATQYFLEYALETKLTVMALDAYMSSTVTPNKSKEEASKDYKVALRAKAEHEGLPQVFIYAAEKVVEDNPDNPDLHEFILKQKFATEEEWHELLIKAGLDEDSQLKLIALAKKHITKLKNIKRWLGENEQTFLANLTQGHEESDNLRFAMEQVHKALGELLEAPIPSLTPEALRLVEPYDVEN